MLAFFGANEYDENVQMTLNIEKNIREDQSEAAKKASIKREKKRKPRKKNLTDKPRTREGSNYPNRPKMTPMKLGTLKNASKYDE